MSRVTIMEIEAKVNRINKVEGRPEYGYADGVAQAGHLFVQGAYGKQQLMLMTDGGGTVNQTGLLTKPEMAIALDAILTTHYRTADNG